MKIHTWRKENKGAVYKTTRNPFIICNIIGLHSVENEEH